MKNSEWVALAHLYHFCLDNATTKELSVLYRVLRGDHYTMNEEMAARGITHEHIRLNVLRLPE